MSGLDDLVRVFESWSLDDWCREIHEALAARELEAAALLIDAMGVYYPRESQRLRDTIRMLGSRPAE